MGKGSKKLYWAGAVAVFLLVVLLALAVIIPRVIDSAWLKATIQTEVAKQVNGDFDFQKAQISILPSPSVTLQQVSLDIPGTIKINLDTIRVYPKLFPLLLGNIELDKIVIDKPDFSFPLPWKPEKKPEQRQTFSLSEILESSSSQLSPLLSAIPGLEIEVHKGTLRLFAAEEQVFLVENINSSFKVNPGAGLEADIQISGASFTTLHKDKKITAKIENMNGNIQLTDNLNSISVEDLTLSSPQIQLNGSFNFDKSVPGASLDIQSQSLDITGVREILPAFINVLYGDLPLVQEIFNIIRGGTITRASFHVEGKSPDDLAEFESMVIQGNVEEADISLTDLGLNLQEVSGDAFISNGVLEGKNLQAKLGNTTGKEGILTHDLVKKEITPFHLDLKLNADLSEVHPTLGKLLTDENIQYHLSLLESLQGTALGRLTLGDSLESLNVRIEVDKINALAKYKLIPYPISIDGGKVLLEGLEIQSHELQGKIGNSTFTNYSDRINWEGDPKVDVQSGTFNLVMDEIYPWITRNETLAEELDNITKITGVADVTVKSFKGPLLQPENLHYDLQGVLKNIALTAKTLPGPLNIETGQINIVPNKITFKDLQADLLGSSLIYSGVIQNFIDGKINADVIVTAATIGNELNTWFAQKIAIPDEYIFRTPLLISPSNIKWTKKELVDLQGDFSIKNGPIITVDLMLTPDEFILRNLSLKNDTEQATIKLDLKKRAIGGQFQGALSQNTIDKIMLHNDIFPDAWIKGDINFSIDMDSPATSTAIGTLDGGNFIFPWKPDNPIRLESFSLSATDKTITLNSAEADLENNKYSITGQASLVQERLSMDFDVRTDTIELDKILSPGQTDDKEEKKEEPEEKKRVGKAWDLALNGNIKLHAGSLLYNGYTWKPFESLITYENNFLGIDILTAELCNLSIPGKISFNDGQIALDFHMEATEQELSEVLICLEGGEQQMTGALNLKANIAGQGTRKTLVNSLQGKLQFSAKDGFIYQDARAAKLLNVLNVSNMFKGKVPDLKNEGFHYDALIVKGVMEKGIITVSPANLEAPIMEIVSQGTIDLPQKYVDLQVLVAPLQALNKIQKAVPIIKTILPTSLTAVPVEIKGDFSDIKVKTMSMSAMSTRVLNIMTDALSSPVRMLEKTPEEEKQD